jgi:stress-induced morphogen
MWHSAPFVQEVLDTSGGCGASFDVSIVAQAFAGKALLARHRLVNDALKEEMAHIHALSIKKCHTPAQAAAAAAQPTA